MASSESRSWVPLGVILALVLTLTVAWAFRDRLSRTVECATLYADAVSAADSARIDSIVVVPAGTRPATTCAELRD